MSKSWPIIALGILAIVFVLMLSFSRKAPVIASLEPDMAAPGQQVVITGDYFGRTEREGSLSLAGEIPPPSLIQSWTDQKIIFVVPEDATSGLVTVSNSQGTSTGVLFTNTESIPTVLQVASSPGKPLLLSLVPPQPGPGQLVTLSGRGFGSGDEPVLVRVSSMPQGPVFDIAPTDSSLWTDRSIAFRLPSGLTGESSLKVVTAKGESVAFPLNVSGPMSYENPRTISLEFRATVSIPASTAVTLWGLVPQRSTGTAWTLVASEPSLTSLSSPISYRWSSAGQSERKATYRLNLTAWACRWDGWPAGAVPVSQEAPVGDPRPKEWWKSATSVLKKLVSKWGLETSDPWLRVQRIQTGLTTDFRPVLAFEEGFSLSRSPTDILASPGLNSLEVSSLAIVLAGQTGIPGRLVSGFWLAPDNLVVPRFWTEIWMAGAGWIPWDVIDGSPGNLDNRHFAFENSLVVPQRLEPRARTFGPQVPGSLGNPSGEASGPSGEPIVQWEIVRTEK